MDVEFLRHQFEDGHDGVVVKNRFKLGVRHIQLVYMMVCATTLGVLRGSTGVAVLALNDVTRQNDTNIHVYNWDGKMKGAVISSFLIGYSLLLIPAEILMRKAKSGGKHVLTVVLVVSGALAVAMPTIVKKGGWIALCNAQLWMGAAHACLSPANQALLARFFLPSEKGVFCYIVHSGTILGVVIGLPVSGILSESRLGWELVFYFQAMLTMSVACLWGLLTAATPDQHEAMGDTEKDLIREALQIYRKKQLQVPWQSILRCRQFWASTCAHAATNAIFVFFLFLVPAFLQTYGSSLKECSLLAIWPFFALLVNVTTSPTINWLSRTMRLSFQVNLTYLRKFINAIGAGAVIAGLTVLPSLSPNWHRMTIVVLAGVLGMLGFQLCGFLESYKDMSENYPGSILMISRAIASIVAALLPVTAGAMLGEDFSDRTRWHAVFLMLATLYMICNVIYTAFGSSDRQYWDGGIVVKDKYGYHNTMLETATALELEDFSQTKKANDYMI